MKHCFQLISKHPKCWQTYACLLSSCETHYLIGTNENPESSTDNKPPANQKQGRCFIPRAVKKNVFSKSTDSQALYIEILFAPQTASTLQATSKSNIFDSARFCTQCNRDTYFSSSSRSLAIVSNFSRISGLA